MAKKDYTKYTKNQPKVDETVEQIVEPVVEEVVEEVVEIVEEVKPVVTGTVINCSKLNVRAKPNSNADVVCVIDSSATVVINKDESINGYWKVCTETGAEGFCMGQYIKILP